MILALAAAERNIKSAAENKDMLKTNRLTNQGKHRLPRLARKYGIEVNIRGVQLGTLARGKKEVQIKQ